MRIKRPKRLLVVFALIGVGTLLIGAVVSSCKNPNQLDAAIKALKTPDTKLNTFTVRCWQKVPGRFSSHLRWLGPTPAHEKRLRACQALAKFGADAVPALPALVAAIDDPDTRVAAAAVQVLGTLGPTAHPAVQPLLAVANGRSTSMLPRASPEVALALACIAPGNAQVVEFLLKQYRDPATYYFAQQAVRELARRSPQAVQIWKDIDTGPPVIQEAIVPPLQIPDHPDNLFYLWRLSNSGPRKVYTNLSARDVPGLAECLLENPNVSSEERVAVAMALLDGSVPNRLWSGLRMVKRIGPPAAPAVPSIIRVLASQAKPLPSSVTSVPSGVYQLSRFTGDRSVKSVSIEALASIGPEAREALPLLSRICADVTDPWRCDAALARYRIDRNAQAAMSVLALASSDPNPDIRAQVFKGAQSLVGFCEIDHQMLTNGLQDPSFRVRELAIDLLVPSRPLPPDLVAPLRALLNDPALVVRIKATNATTFFSPL